MQTEDPIHLGLAYIWDRHEASLFNFQEDEEIKALKSFYDASSKLSGTAWCKVGRRVAKTIKEPFLTRSLEPYRRFLGKVIQVLPEPFNLPSDLVAKILGVTQGQASKVIKWWVGYGLIEEVGETKPGQLKAYKRRLLK